jgi:hypothetical protein
LVINGIQGNPITGDKIMKYLWIVIVLVATLCSQLLAQETDLKKIYTDVTTRINSALLTRKGAYELNGFIYYNRLTTRYKQNLVIPEDKIETFQVEAGGAHFFMNNLSLGILLSYLNQKQNNLRTDQTMAGPMIKKYFGDKEWRPYLFSDYLFLSGDNLDGGEWDMGAGLLYHVTGNFGIIVQVKYGILFANEESIKSQNRLFVGIGIINFIL